MAFKSESFKPKGIPIIKASNIKESTIKNITSFISPDNQNPNFEKVRLLTGDREEGEVVGEMNYKFNQYGFDFEEAGIGDKMVVKSANDEELIVPLDAFGLPMADALEIGAKGRAEELRQFLIKNKKASVEAFNKASKNEQEYLNKIQGKNLSSYVIDISNVFTFRKNKINYQFKKINKKQYFLKPKNIFELYKISKKINCISMYQIPDNFRFAFKQFILKILGFKKNEFK